MTPEHEHIDRRAEGSTGRNKLAVPSSRRGRSPWPSAGSGPLRGQRSASSAGEVCGLIGPNGAGKTTLFDCLTGIRDPTDGAIRFDGDDVTGRTPTWCARQGIRRTFQRQQIFGWLPVEDNVLVALEWRGGGGGLAADLLALPSRRSRERPGGRGSTRCSNCAASSPSVISRRPTSRSASPDGRDGPGDRRPPPRPPARRADVGARGVRGREPGHRGQDGSARRRVVPWSWSSTTSGSSCANATGWSCSTWARSSPTALPMWFALMKESGRRTWVEPTRARS